MGMKFASKFNGTLVVKTQLFKLVKGMLSVTGPANTQKDDVHAAAVPPPTVVQASCPHSISFQSSAHAAGLHSVGGVVSCGGCRGHLCGLLSAV
eukprot:442381-Pelagomonas_calceolata.AAC.1